MNVVVTGGAGYIGSIVTAQLLAAGHRVTILDNLSRGYADAMPKGARFIQADVSDFGKVISEDDHIDAVVHLAAFISVGESALTPELYWHNNVVGSLHLLTALRQLGIRKLVFASTAATYGTPKSVPITEEAPTLPESTYGMTKLAIDNAITGESEAYGLTATSLRFFNVAGAYGGYGERHEPETHIIPLALAAVAGHQPTFTLYGDDYPTPDGSCVRDYIHVADLAHAIQAALAKSPEGKHSIYNLGNGGGFSNREVLQTIEEVTGTKLHITIGPRRAGDPAILVASSEKIRQELGWQPETPGLHDMIQDAWEFYRFR